MQEKPFSLTSHHTDKQHRLLKWSLLSLYFISVPLLADPVNQALSIDAREQQRQQERERMLQQQNNPALPFPLSVLMVSPLPIFSGH